jgi:glycine hydroxymethyltransferase
MHMTIGGHLTHGEKINFSGRTFNFIRYGVSRDTERIDYTELEKLAKQHKPAMIVTGASAYPRITISNASGKFAIWSEPN